MNNKNRFNDKWHVRYRLKQAFAGLVLFSLALVVLFKIYQQVPASGVFGIGRMYIALFIGLLLVFLASTVLDELPTVLLNWSQLDKGDNKRLKSLARIVSHLLSIVDIVLVLAFIAFFIFSLFG